MTSSMLKRVVALFAIAIIIPACGGGGSGGSAITNNDIPGEFRITARGGNGTTGGGGGGGYLEVYANYTASDIQVLETGTVNAGSTVTPIKPYLGTDPCIIGPGTTTITVADYVGSTINSVITPPSGFTATGLWVQPGAILILECQDGYTAALDFSDGIFIEGEIRVVLNAGLVDTGNLDLNANSGSIVITASGRINTSGADSAVTAGNGGNVDLYADNTIVNAGLVATTGGNGDDGGSGGQVDFYVYYYGIYNSGTIDSSGGNGITLGGGSGGEVELGSGGYSNEGPVSNNGTIRTRGGNGVAGGYGGALYLWTEYIGAITNAGLIDTAGGTGLLGGTGGYGGYIEFDAYNGSVRISGTLTSVGGSSPTGDGGSGGYINIYGTHEDDTFFNDPELGPRGIYVGANIDCSGGSGLQGSYGGGIYIYNNVDSSPGSYGNALPGAAPIFLVGYISIDISGGDSVDGNGGDCSGDGNSYLHVYDDGYNEYQDVYYAAGNIFNEIPWIGRGGNSTTNDGGSGATVYFRRYSDQIYPEPAAVVSNSGAIDLRGGTGGGDDGGSGGYFNMDDDFSVVNEGDVFTSGGDGIYGGYAGYIELVVYGSFAGVANSGNLTARGGTGTDYGGGGNHIYVRGNYVDPLLIDNSGNLDSRGGSGFYGGGSGGEIRVEYALEIVHSGTIMSGGGNSTDGSGGSAGYITIYARYRIDATGNINADGGDSVTADGGYAGYYVQIYTQDSVPPPGEETFVLVNGNISARGGSGDYARYGGNFYAYDYTSLTINGTINVSGGDAISSTAGDSGSFDLSSDGNLTLNGGVNDDGGNSVDGSGGNHYNSSSNIIARRVTIIGGVTGRGGNSTNGFGGSGEWIFILSTEGGSNLSGTFSSAGGTGGAGDGLDDYLFIDGLESDSPTVTF